MAEDKILAQQEILAEQGFSVVQSELGFWSLRLHGMRVFYDYQEESSREDTAECWNDAVLWVLRQIPKWTPEYEHSIRPCPYCGQMARAVFSYPLYDEDGIAEWQPEHQITCEGCGALGPNGETGEECRDRWNTRTAPPIELPAALSKIEELTEALRVSRDSLTDFLSFYGTGEKVQDLDNLIDDCNLFKAMRLANDLVSQADGAPTPTEGESNA